MTDDELSLVPVEARPYQGTSAGIVTRLAANSLDALVVVTALVGAYVGWAAILFLVDPRQFRFPEPPFEWFVLCFLGFLVVYLTTAWWVSGRSFGDHVMGIRVVTGRRSRSSLVMAFGRALMCAFFPIGLLWCVVDPKRRAVHDLVMRTSVIYDWLPRPTSPRRDEDDRQAGVA